MLRLRPPVIPYILTGLFASLLVQASVWFFVRIFLAPLSDVIEESLLQSGLSLFWMIGCLCLWALQPPKTRLYAIGLGLACVGFVAIFGSLTALFRHMRPETDAGGGLYLGFGILSLFMILIQMILALPGLVTLAQITLKSPLAHAPPNLTPPPDLTPRTD
jgi:hypothetical protein